MSSPPSIVRLVPTLDFGGVESRIVTQSELMRRAGLDFRVCTFHRAGDAARRVAEVGVPVDVLNVDPRLGNPTATVALAAYLLRQRPRVLHASILEANFHACLARRLVAHAPALAIEEVGVPVRALAARALLSGVYAGADVVLGVSQTTCDDLVRRHWLPAAKVRLLYNALHPRFLAPPPRRHGRGAPGRRLSLAVVGRLVEVKNHATLLRALSDLPANRRPRVTLAGEGPLRAELERLARALDLTRDVRFVGYRSDVLPLLDEADGYVLPSLNEGTSISLAEAMARALPVLTSRAPGVDELMAGYPPGWQVAPRDVAGWTAALGRMSALKPDERALLGARARALAEERLSPAAWEARLRALYGELGGGPRAAAPPPPPRGRRVRWSAVRRDLERGAA